MHTIMPYCLDGRWFFDDPNTGLVREALTDGVPDIIEAVAIREDIRDYRNGFRCTFSDVDFDSHLMLILMGPWRDGHLYVWHEQWRICWFCPALLRYYESAPAQLFMKVDNRPSDSGSPRISGIRSGGSIPLGLIGKLL